ncbi:hypothetical protein A4X13_0g2388 [Tilletia indica]|uniref:Ysc84 actin-binding domain-containing protein n=1 Tax=Tilletia indica TaxID=43049 RepID=A0A177TQJ3_9BASI|nr:hypothetical protein A4X13_0g2388 [Tilletia indica]
MFQKLKEKATAAAADPRLDKTKAGLKKAETGLWKALEPVGKWSNKTAGKLGAESFWPTSMDLECDKAARILRTFTSTGAHADADPSADATGGVLGGATKTPQQLEAERKLHKYDERKTQKVIKKIPQEVIASAKGLAIFTVFRTGFGLSGAGGSGVVVKRLPDGSWSGPSGLLLHTIGWGFLIGLDIYDVVLVLRTDKAVEAFRNPKISVGAEIAVAAGPVGSGAMLDSGPEASPAFSYVKSKGFYAGLQLDGNIILKRKDENSRFYNIPDVSTADIFAGRIPPPRAAYPLLKTIYAAEGRAPPTVTHFGADVVIPEGPTPGDLSLTADEAAMLEEEAKKQQGSHEQSQGQGQGQAYGAGAGVGHSGSTSVGGAVPVHSAMGTATVAGTGTTTSALASSGYAPPASNPYGGGSGYAPPSSNPYGGGHGQQTFQDTSSAAPAHYVPGPGGGVGGAGVLAAAAAGAGVGAGVASASHSAGVQPDRKQSELWEQPPPDYDFSTAPPAATQQQYQQQPPVPATGATALHDPFQDQAQAPLPPPSSAPLTAEQEKEQLRQRHENQALPPPPPPPVQAAGPSAPLSAEEEKELLKKRHEAEAAANASGGASGSAAPPYPQGPPGQGNNPPGSSNQWYDHSDIVHLPQ